MDVDGKQGWPQISGFAFKSVSNGNAQWASNWGKGRVRGPGDIMTVMQAEKLNRGAFR